MDKRTLRAIIVESRDKFNLTYKEIADLLESKYEIKRSKQAVAAMYKRYKEKIENVHEKSEDSITEEDIVNVVNVYCIVDNCKDTQCMLSTIGYNIEYKKILCIINNNKAYIDDVTQIIINRMANNIRKAVNDSAAVVGEVDLEIEYKGIRASENKISYYIKEAIAIIICELIVEEIDKISNIVNDSTIKRYLINKFNIKQ